MVCSQKFILTVTKVHTPPTNPGGGGVGKPVTSTDGFNFRSEHDSKMFAADGLYFETMSLWNSSKLVGLATYDDSQFVSRKEINLDMIRIIKTTYDRFGSETALLVLQKDGIAERVGRVRIRRDQLGFIPWEQKLIVLG